MEWDSNLNLIVYAIGDGLFMERVLNGIAAMYNKGMFQSIGALGLLFGLLMTVVKGVGSGGQKIELGQWFLGLLLYLIMFAGNATVTVRDVGMSFGENGEQTYTVDNVPFGVAVMGFAISTIGYEVTEELEQAFGRPEEVASIRYVGPGRSLDWLAAVRFASNPGTNNAAQGGSFARMRSNISRYISYCSTTALRAEPNRIETMMNAANPLDPAIGLGWENDWRLTSWVEDNGAESQISCKTALERLQPYAADIMEPAAQAFAAQMGHSGSDTPGDAVLQSFAVYNQGMDEAQRYMLCSVMSAVMEDSIAGSPLLTNDQVNARMMMRQSMEQSATEFAGQESSFRRLMRPLMAFFESLVYAVAPFMALAVGLGAAGLKMVGKYVITTLWVSMWLPTLAIINLFQITMAERALTQITDSYDIGSLAGCGLVYGSAIDWIGTGAMLAAATPAITLMLIFGSSMSAAGIASAIKGSDTVNERVASPDAVSPAAAASRASLQDYSHAQGAVETKSAIPTLNFSSRGSATESSGFSGASSAVLSWGDNGGRQVAQALAADVSSGVRGEQVMSQQATRAHTNAVQALQGRGVDLSNMTEEGQRAVMAVAASAGVDGSIDFGKLFPAGRLASLVGGGQGGGRNEGESGGRGRTDSPARGGVHGGVEGRHTDEDTYANLNRVAQQIRSAMNDDNSLRATVQGGVTAAAHDYSQVQGSQTSRVGETADLQKMSTDQIQAAQTFSRAQAMENAAATNYSVPLSDVGQRIANNPGLLAEARAAALELGGADAIQAAMSQLGNLQGGDQRAAAAYAMVLNNQAMGLREGYENERKDALASILSEAGLMPVNAGAGWNPNSGGNASVGAEAEAAAGNARDAVEAANVGGMDAEAVAARTEQTVAATRSQDGRDNLKDTVIAGTGVPVGEAQAGGERAQVIEGSGGMVSADGFSADGGVAAVRAAGTEANDGLVGTAARVLEPGISNMREENMAKPIAEAAEEAEAMVETTSGVMFGAMSAQVNYDDPVAVSERLKDVNERLGEIDAAQSEGSSGPRVEPGYMRQMREAQMDRGYRMAVNEANEGLTPGDPNFVQKSPEGERAWLEEEQGRLETAWDYALPAAASQPPEVSPMDEGVKKFDPDQ